MSISFSEVLLVGLVALVVIKPEQLPEAARMLGQFVRGIRKTAAKVKEEVEYISQLPEEKKEERRP